MRVILEGERDDYVEAMEGLKAEIAAGMSGLAQAMAMAAGRVA